MLSKCHKEKCRTQRAQEPHRFVYDSDCKGRGPELQGWYPRTYPKAVKGHLTWISGERVVQTQRTESTEGRRKEHAQGIRELELHGSPGLCHWLQGPQQKSCNVLGIGFYLVTSSCCGKVLDKSYLRAERFILTQRSRI